jgi:hypothetical protein
MKPSNGVPDANEFGKIRSYLAQQGVKQADITEYLGTSVGGRNRGEIAASLKDMCRSFPKAT